MGLESRLREKIDPVADWYDADGEEGDKPDIVDVVGLIVEDLVSDRKDLLHRQSLGVWTLDDEMWVIAGSIEEAKRLVANVTDIAEEDIGNCRRVTAKELGRLHYYDDIEERKGGRSFLEQIGKLVLEGDWKPKVFAVSGA